MTAFVGDATTGRLTSKEVETCHRSIYTLIEWLESEGYKGYDTFDGLSATLLRPFTFELPQLRIALQQGIRRFPLNLRPWTGVRKAESSKAMGFFARGFLRLYRATSEDVWVRKAQWALDWLVAHISPGYSGSCWGNHFDYQSRVFYLPKGTPTVVWTSLIGHAFLDFAEQQGNSSALEVAESCCRHILEDLIHVPHGDATCISYIPGEAKEVHNANTLAGSLLARVYAFNGDKRLKDLSERSIRYTAMNQRPDGSWYYGESSDLRWVDSFHTAYVLDSLKIYTRCTGDRRFEDAMQKGYSFWKGRFFEPDGTPRYYDNRRRPIDIQCSSQAIDTLCLFSDLDPEALDLAKQVAFWTIRNMQDPSGYFYYRRYGRRIVNKTPTLHWGQATMLSALTSLYVEMTKPA
jgi:hypothetical protein